ncbi:MAG: PKD domain-containing protein [Chloroherpetonaceae bacterium]|nr:PKD domain-containing protein [Chloroherpetonaceae bacterium]
MKRFRHRFLILGISFLLFSSSQLLSQDDTQQYNVKVSGIRTDPSFLFAEISDESLEAARNAAKKLVIEQIVQNVFSQSNLESKQVNGEYTESYSMTVRSTSRLNLQGLRFIDGGKQNDGKYKAFAFIKLSDVEASFNDVAEQLRGVILTAEQVEKNLGLSKSIDQYLRAYLQSFYSPKPIKYKSELQNVEFPDARAFLDLKLKLYFSQIDIKVLANNIEESGTERTSAFTIPVELYYRNQPVEKLFAKLESQDSPQITVIDGKGKFTLYGDPDAPKKEFRLKLIPYLDKKSLPPDMLENFESERFIDQRRLQIEFSKIVNIDFSAEINEFNVVFTPILKHVSLLPDGINWDFGDGNTSKTFKASTRYAKPGVYKVTLTVNNIKDFKVTKEIEVKANASEGVDIIAVPKIQLPPILASLSPVTSADSVFSVLTELKNKGKITFGRQTDFSNTDRCVVIVVNPKEKKLSTIFTDLQTDKTRKDFFTGESLQDVKEKTKGMQAIWVQIN